MTITPDRQAHWNRIYETKRAEEVSWFQPTPDLSLTLIRSTGVAHDAAIIDVGGGASTLVDRLLADGFSDLTVLDISEAGLQQAQLRLGRRAEQIEWIAADMTAWRPRRSFDLWHDRAVLHFLTDAEDQAAYANAVRSAVAPDGRSIIGGFAPGGPTECSGLDIVQHDADSLSALLGPQFHLLEAHGEVHVTPWGAGQTFRYHIFLRKR